MTGQRLQGGRRAMPTHGHMFPACSDTWQRLAVGACSCANPPARAGTCVHAAVWGCHTWKTSPSSYAQMCSHCARLDVLAHGHTPCSAMCTHTASGTHPHGCPPLHISHRYSAGGHICRECVTARTQLSSVTCACAHGHPCVHVHTGVTWNALPVPSPPVPVPALAQTDRRKVPSVPWQEMVLWAQCSPSALSPG